MTDSEIGAYGLRLEDVEDARPLLVPASPAWPRLRIRSEVGLSELPYDSMSEATAELKLQNGGEIRVDRAAGEATFLVPEPLTTAAIVHPLLAPAAAVMGYWLGRESFHAGAFVAGGKAWGLVGDRGVGKSTMVARLALDGLPVVCDDMLVLEQGRAHVAPRSVDLRESAAEHLGVGEALGVVGARERWRFRIGSVEGEPELGGWIFLEWGERVEAVRVPAALRVTALHDNRGVRLPPRNPASLLELAALPSWELRRPQRWESLADAVDCLLETVG